MRLWSEARRLRSEKGLSNGLWGEAICPPPSRSSGRGCRRYWDIPCASVQGRRQRRSTGWAPFLLAASMPTLEPDQLAIREMREDEAPLVLELLKDGFKDTENRLILYVLTRPLALLLMAVVSSGLRFFLNSFVVALVLPVLLTVVALKLLLWRSPDLKHLHAYYSAGQRGLWVAVYDEDDVCGCVALEPRGGEPHAAELKRLAVNRWYRRSGVGRCLLSFLEEQARAQGFKFLVAQVSVVTKAAMELFESAGYSVSGGHRWLGYTIQQEFSKEL